MNNNWFYKNNKVSIDNYLPNILLFFSHPNFKKVEVHALESRNEIYILYYTVWYNATYYSSDYVEIHTL